MRTHISDIKNSGVSDPVILYFAGVFTAHVNAELNMSQVFTFIKQIFENSIFSNQRQQIEKLLILGDIGKIVEIIENFRCSICTKFDEGLLKLTCGHLLHEKCFLGDISLKIKNGRYSCPTCQKVDNDVGRLSEEARNLIKTQQMATILENNSDMSICPNCSTICELEEPEIKCLSCQTVFCGYCLQENGCICD